MSAHVIRLVETKDRLWRALCSCGWSGAYCDNSGEASDDGKHHKASS